MESSPRRRVASLTAGEPLSTRDTVPTPTPACCATFAIVAPLISPGPLVPHPHAEVRGTGSILPCLSSRGRRLAAFLARSEQAGGRPRDSHLEHHLEVARDARIGQ